MVSSPVAIAIEARPAIAADAAGLPFVDYFRRWAHAGGRNACWLIHARSWITTVDLGSAAYAVSAGISWCAKVVVIAGCGVGLCGVGAGPRCCVADARIVALVLGGTGLHRSARALTGGADLSSRASVAVVTRDGIVAPASRARSRIANLADVCESLVARLVADRSNEAIALNLRGSARCATPVAAPPVATFAIDDEREFAPVAPGNVRLKVRACGVCRTDLHMADGWHWGYNRPSRPRGGYRLPPSEHGGQP
jgi:hypothetical protein